MPLWYGHKITEIMSCMVRNLHFSIDNGNCNGNYVMTENVINVIREIILGYDIK